MCEVTITSKALLEKAIEEGAAVVTEGWAGVGLVTEPMFGVIILKLPQPVRTGYWGYFRICCVLKLLFHFSDVLPFRISSDQRLKF